MDNKLSELSKPSAEVVSKFGDPEAFGERELRVLTDIQKLAYGTKFYSQEYVSALLAELEREIEMRAQNLEIKTLLAEKVKGLETKLWDSQQLVDAKSSSQIELRSQISSIEESSRKDMAWRGERLCELEDSLEAAQKRIAELERSNQSQDDHINQQQDRIDSLEKTNAGLGRRLAAAEKRLTTPVRLPDSRKCVSGDRYQWSDGVHNYRQDTIATLRELGFIVGDE